MGASRLAGRRKLSSPTRARDFRPRRFELGRIGRFTTCRYVQIDHRQEVTSSLTTAQVARIAGVASTTVKRWADEGVLPFERTAGGHRRFARTAVERVLREMHSANDDDPIISSWLQCLLDGRRHLVDGQLLTARARLGTWYRVADELGRVLTELGTQWATGALSIAQEHAASECLSRALNRIGDGMPLADEGPRSLLVCAPGDDHTLGLSLAELCLREAGRPTQWGGRKMPLDEILSVVRGGDIDLVVVSASAVSRDPELLREFADGLAVACAEAQAELVLGGAGAWPEDHARAARLSSFEALHQLLMK